MCDNCFNRYMVECESSNRTQAQSAFYSFNRYMVECELIRASVIFLMLKGFNRYMVECEYLIGGNLMGAGTNVLIDTWWNVNVKRSNRTYLRFFVLIDTWWNVNKASDIASFLKLFVLIDTWWNVNSLIQGATSLLSGFNRYMVECECKAGILTVSKCACFNRYMVECECSWCRMCNL